MLLVAVFVGVFIKVMSSPAEGTIITTPQDNIAAASAIKSEPGIYKGKYVSFSLPMSYKQAASQGGKSYLDNAIFIATDHSSKQLSARVLKQSMANDPPINFRRQHPDVYHEQVMAGGRVFTKTKGGSERTMFITHGNLELTVAFSSPHDGEDFMTDMDSVINSLKWLK